MATTANDDRSDGVAEKQISTSQLKIACNGWQWRELTRHAYPWDSNPPKKQCRQGATAAERPPTAKTRPTTVR